MNTRTAILAALVASVVLPAVAWAEARDAENITPDNLYDHSAYWPNIVTMERAWTTPGGKLLKAKYPGVLIRVKPSGSMARIDFGRHGVHDVPFDRTDIVAAANAIRIGEKHKLAPNFVLLIGTKLLDSGAARRAPVPSPQIASGRVFLCVFADPKDPGFSKLVEQIASFETRDGLRTIFFPQDLANEDVDPVKARLRELEWTVPMSTVASYSHSLLPPKYTLPYALLVSPEGLLFYETALGKTSGLVGLRGAIDSQLRIATREGSALASSAAGPSSAP